MKVSSPTFRDSEVSKKFFAHMSGNIMSTGENSELNTNDDLSD